MDTFKIAHDFFIEVLPTTKHYSADLEAEVERIWQQEKQRRGDHLYNGKLLSLLSIDFYHLLGEAVDYKHYLAAYTNPALAEAIGINPVAVTGVVSSGDKFLLGERSSTVLNYHGLLEFVPSGGIEQDIDAPGRISPAQQLLLELFEETGIEASSILNIKPLIAIKEKQWRPIDICISITLSLNMLNYKNFPYTEHAKFHWLSKEDLVLECQHYRERFSPLALEIVKFL